MPAVGTPDSAHPSGARVIRQAIGTEDSSSTTSGEQLREDARAEGKQVFHDGSGELGPRSVATPAPFGATRKSRKNSTTFPSDHTPMRP